MTCKRSATEQWSQMASDDVRGLSYGAVGRTMATDDCGRTHVLTQWSQMFATDDLGALPGSSAVVWRI
jgi:hypothetical protein